MDTKNDRFGVAQTANGYVAGVRCNRDHSGSRRLSGPTRDAYECEGCRQWYSAGDVRRAQQAAAGTESASRALPSLRTTAERDGA